MQTWVSRWRLPEMVGLGAGLLALAAVSGLLASAQPSFVPLMALGLVGAAVLLLRPEVGVFIMWALVLFKPEAVQDLGFLSPMRLVAAALAGILVLTVLLGRPADFLRSNQVRLYLLLGVLLVINWFFVGGVEPPAYLAAYDQTSRTLSRYVIHIAFLIFIVAFVRTPRQLLALTGLFILGIFVTIPGALSSASDTATKVEALRAAAVAGVRAAENANRLAFISLMGISIIWFALQHYRSALLRLGGGLVILALMLTVFRSGSRSGVLNLGLLLVLLLLQSRMNPGHFGLIIVAALVSLVAVVMLVPDAVMQRLMSLVVSQEYQPRSLALSTSGRLALLAAGFKLAVESPLMGVGIGNFRWATTFDIEHGGISAAAHNAYLLALAEGGIVLLAGYLLLFWVTARDLNRTLRQSARLPEVGLGWLVLATRTNLILLLVFSLFAEAWKEFFILLILGTAGVLTQLYTRASQGATGGRATSAPVVPAA